jgi:ribonuclease BN (tRNA processing enzyme)
MARLGLPWYALTHLFITHFHTDHVGDLAYLLFALKHGQPTPREEELRLFGPEGLEDHLEALSRAHGDHIQDPGFPLTVRELQAGEVWESPEGAVRLLTRATIHTDNSLAVRVETANGALGYTGDTGPAPDLAPFFRKCDVLIAECSDPDGMERPNHLTPGGLATLATRADPKVLVPVHSYPPLDPERIPGQLEGAGFHGQVLTGWDGLGLDLAGGGVKILGTKTE